MAVEDIGAIYPTKIPGLDEVADIQEALRLYHYGSTVYDPDNTNKAILPVPSMANNLKLIEQDIADITAIGIGSAFAASEPTSIQDGYIWVDADAVPPSEVGLPTAFYQISAPTSGLTEGMLWVDKDTSPLKMYVYDSIDGWKQIG